MLAQLSLFSKTTTTNKKEESYNTKATQSKPQAKEPQKTIQKEATMNKNLPKEESKPKTKIEIPLEAKTKIITFTSKIKKGNKEELDIKDLTIEDIEEAVLETRMESPTEIYYNFYEYKLLFLDQLRKIDSNIANWTYEEICKKLSETLYPMTPKILREMHYIERNSRRKKYLDEVRETLFKTLRISGIARQLKENQIILNETGNPEEILKSYEEVRQYLINKYPPEKQKVPITENKFLETLALIIKKYSKNINVLSNFTNKAFYHKNKILQGVITTWNRNATYEIPIHSMSETLKKININSVDIIFWKTKDTEETPADLSEIQTVLLIVSPSLRGKFSQVVKGNSFNLAVYMLSAALKDGGYLILNHEKEIKKEIFENKKHQYYMIPVVKITNKNHQEEENPYTTIFIKVSKENLNKITVPSKAFEIEVDLNDKESIENVRENVKKFIKENLESYTDLLAQENEIKKEIIQALQNKVDELKKTTKLNSHQSLINPLIEKAEKLKMKEFVELAENTKHKLNENIKFIKNVEPIKTNFSRYVKIKQIKLSSSQILSQDEEQHIKKTAKEIAKRLLQETQNNIVIRLLMALQIVKEIANDRLEAGTSTIFTKGYETYATTQNSFEFETKDIDRFISEEVVFPINLLNVKSFEELIEAYLLKFKNKEILITRRSEEMKTFSINKIEKEKAKEFERIMLKIINRSFDTHFTDLKIALEKIARINSPYRTTKEKIAYAIDITAQEYKVNEKTESGEEALRRRDYSNLMKLAKEICERINNKDEYIKTVIKVKNRKLFNTVESIKKKLDAVKNSLEYEDEKIQALKEQISKVGNKRYKELIGLIKELVKEKEILNKG